ncbi:YoaK family protein [Teichococcus rhizosphaerae]|uniref:YoaK family protein n=1 Tax=Teichococcus rhizosphaerae TaxID=1335062 RepID=UPI00346359C9
MVRRRLARPLLVRWFRGGGLSEAGLSLCLAAVAGAVNAGGFLLVGAYTSHMSGIVSAMADHLVLGAMPVVLAGLLALLAFTAGAGVSAVLINRGRRRGRRNPYLVPLRLEAGLLLAGGGVGWLAAREAGGVPPVALATPLLCFLMGLQNATITKISGARMRTTHMTGVITDIGVELGKLLYWNRAGLLEGRPFVRADRARLRLLLALLGSFFLGGVAGAAGFLALGFAFCLPLAALLMLAAEAMRCP